MVAALILTTKTIRCPLCLMRCVNNTSHCNIGFLHFLCIIKKVIKLCMTVLFSLVNKVQIWRLFVCHAVELPHVLYVCFVQGEGVAYRGRVLVELVSTLGETPETPIADIENDDLLRVQVCC